MLRMKMKSTELEIFIDGASSGNPGDAAVGVVIKHKNGMREEKISQYLGTGTNNFAEYQALIIALERVRQLGADSISVKSDSELLVRQINGEYKIKNDNLKQLFLKVEELKNGLRTFKINHVRREFNKEADSLAKNAIERFRRANRMAAPQ